MPVQFYKRGPIVTEADIDDVESRNSASISPEYRAFLLALNGGQPEFHVFRNSERGNVRVQLFFGIWDEEYFDIDVENRRMRGRCPERFLSIAIDDGGNRFLLSVEPPDYGSVYYWDHEEEAEENEEPTEENLYHVAGSFAEFWERIEPIDSDVYLAERLRERQEREPPPPRPE